MIKENGIGSVSMWNRLIVKIGLRGLFFILISGISLNILTAYPPSPTLATVPGNYQSNVPSYMNLLRNFDYNSQAPLEVREKLIASSDSLVHFEISYMNPRRWRVVAELVKPAGTGPYAGLIYLCNNSEDRQTFLNEARTLVHTGIVALIVDTSMRLADSNAVAIDLDSQTIQSVLDIRRAVDYLLARPEIDPRRIGFVGNAEGANLGGIIAGVEKRIRALILISANVCPSESADQAPSAFLDGLHYIGYAAPANLLLQYNVLDNNISRDMAQLCFQAASQPKTLNWYSTDPLRDPQAHTDRLDWICKQLINHATLGVSAGELLETSQ